MKELTYPFNNQIILNSQKRLKQQLLEQKQEFQEKKIAILSGSTVGELQGVLEIFLLNDGIKPVFLQGDYNRYYEEAVFENDRLKEFMPDIVYVHISVRDLIGLINTSIQTAEYTLPEAENIFQHFREILDSIKKKYNCCIIINNFEPLPYRILGNADVWHPLGELNLINKVNQLLYQYVREHEEIYVNDLNYEASDYGLRQWFDESYWYMFKYPFSLDAIPSVAFNIANIIKSAAGKSHKLIITDLDNTLWGGIIGDDGLEKIELGTETPAGMAYQDFQIYLKKLYLKGITLSVCSKNETETAKQGFQHRNSILKMENFMSFKANWNPKPSNISEILKEINFMSNSAVFLDDNPTERDQAASAFNEMSVPCLDNVEKYRNILDKSGYFETTSITSDDLNRNAYYKGNISRKEEEHKFADYGRYLHSLNMTAKINKISEENIVRTVQLINKTNQFNLTTIRYTQEELTQYLLPDSHFGICGRLTDKFGDNGIVTVLLGELKGNSFFIQNWIMSCRVFKRELEYAIFDVLVQLCKNNKVDDIIGDFIPTNKNMPVSGLFSSLGFESLEELKHGSRWIYHIPDFYQKMNRHIKIEECAIYE